MEYWNDGKRNDGRWGRYWMLDENYALNRFLKRHHGRTCEAENFFGREVTEWEKILDRMNKINKIMSSHSVHSVNSVKKLFGCGHVPRKEGEIALTGQGS